MHWLDGGVVPVEVAAARRAIEEAKMSLLNIMVGVEEVVCEAGYSGM